MTVVPMRDSTTDGLMFVRPIPQGSAPPDLGAFWTDEYGWLVPDTRVQDLAKVWGAYTEVIKDGQKGVLEWLDVIVKLDTFIGENNDD